MFCSVFYGHLKGAKGMLRGQDEYNVWIRTCPICAILCRATRNFPGLFLIRVVLVLSSASKFKVSLCRLKGQVLRATYSQDHASLSRIGLQRLFHYRLTNEVGEYTHFISSRVLGQLFRLFSRVSSRLLKLTTHDTISRESREGVMLISRLLWFLFNFFCFILEYDQVGSLHVRCLSNHVRGDGLATNAGHQVPTRRCVSNS